MKKFMKFLQRHSKKIGLIAAVTAVATLGVVAASAWGPDRPTYTVDHPADHITFNSITDNTNVGDERNFVVVKDAANTNAGGWQDDITVQPGKEYLVRIYAHNNAASSLKLTATNTRVSASVPTTTGKKVPLSGFVSADNATPQKVWDDISFNSTKDFNVKYVAGSAKIYNNGYAAGGSGKSLPDSIVTAGGALIGYNGPDGKVPGCFQYANYITFKVKPQFAPSTTFEVAKTVSEHGKFNWVENVNAKPGDTVDYRIKYKNTGEIQQNNVVVKDKLPANMTYVNGSSKLYNALFPNGKTLSDNVTGVGVNIGSHAPNASSFVVFSAKVGPNDKLAKCEINVLKNVASVTTDYGTKTDDANVTVNKYCVPATPNFTIVKNVRKKGDTKWAQNVTVEYGDTVQYQILVKNTGNTELKNVVVKDNRPTGVDYVNGTLKVNGATSTQDLFKAGVTIPSIAKNGQAEITFDAKVNKGQTDKCEVKKFQNIASAKPEGLTEKTDDANVTTECNVVPAYECSAVQALALGGNKYRFTVQTKTSGGATVNKFIYNYGDATPEFNTDKNVVEHQYAKPGEYNVVVRVLFNIGSTQKEARCTAKVVIPTNPCIYDAALPADSPDCKPPTSVPPVTSIPSTGAGTVAAGIFGTSATAYGVLAMVDSRRALKKNLK